jgi:glutaredoxin
MIKQTAFSLTILTSLFFTLNPECSALESSKFSKQATSKEKPQLLLYYTPWCPYSQKVLNYLTQIHKTVPMKNLQNDPKGKEELKKIGGKSQVPCLVINGKAMYESADIIRWLSQNQAFLD